MDYSNFDKYLGNALYEARVVKRLTQEKMAEMISAKLKEAGRIKGITRSAYSFYESGDRSMPSDVYDYACEILDIDGIKIFNDACDHIKK